MSSAVLSRRLLLRAGLGAGALAGLAPLVAACGGSGGGGALPAGPPADLKGATIRAMVNQPHVLAFTQLLAPAFEREFGGKLTATAVPYDQLTSQQILDVQGGAGQFDVFDYFYFGLGVLVDADALVDLTDYIAANPAIDPADFLPSVYDPYTLLNGRRYGLPFDGDTHVLYYNRAVFDRYGVAPPKTWDEYDQVTRTITERSNRTVYGAVVEGQQVPMILGCSFINRLAGYGGTLVGPDGAPKLSSPEAKAALQHLVDVAPYALPTPLQIGFDQANSAFLSGQAAMLDTWTDLGLKAQDSKSSKIVDQWGVVPLPVGGTNTQHRTALNSGFGLGVSTAAKDKAKAAAFVTWATDTTRNLLLASTGGSGIDPARRSVLDSPDYAKASAPATEVIREGLTGSPLVWPKDKLAPKLLQDLVDQLALAIQGTQSVDQSLSNAQSGWERALA
ncbi:ABC transporter substrate-binding protein [Pseudonocardia spinosispora]|uniref:ABC transporter substrate-binding protein n=1 Tax=Pseudonocardia spinosispora TaxID=103441 RepID=UPI000411550A|nr:sugar ABC transporter substrate-binding protein [Pseudonocardia spinosispora]